MPTRRAIAFCFALALLFWIANRASYKGYFSGDDLAAIALMRQVSFSQWLAALVTPVFNPNNFRPTGYALYGLLDRGFGLDFTPYLATVQILHGIVTLLVYTLARRLGLQAWPATVGALFFTFHMALFGAFWKPMYNFDIFCALFVIVSILAWLRMDGWQWWLASFVSFWLAYKSKEVAVMLPAVLLLIEAQGKRRWLLLAPFFAVSLSFGIQAMLSNQTGAYHLELSPQTVTTTASIYADHVMLARWGILALLCVLAIARQRWPIWAAFFFLLPMLVLPGRTAAVYLYLPMVFIAILTASAAQRAIPTANTGLVIWLALNFLDMRGQRNVTLAEARQARAYFTTMERNAAQLRSASLVQFDGYPPSIQSWGAEAAVRLVLGRSPNPSGEQTVASWHPGSEVLSFYRNEPGTYLDMRGPTNVRLEDGWFEPEAQTRWTKPRAELHLKPPERATRFEVRILVPELQLQSTEDGVVTVRVSIGRDTPENVGEGRRHGETFMVSHSGWHTFEISSLSSAWTDGVLAILNVTPTFKPDPNGRELGVAVGAIGFR